MDDLIAFVSARLDEDEAAAKAAAAGTPGKWEVGSDGCVVNDAARYGSLYYVACGHGEDAEPDSENALHVARHDPARVLREVTAKRAVLEWWQRGDPDPDGPAPSATYENYRKSLPGYQLILSMAAIWSDHRDYRQQWADMAA